MPEEIRFREVKREIRVIGVDDCPFELRSKEPVDLIGVVYRGGYWLDGVLKTTVQADGFDATERIIEMIMNSPHYEQLRVVMLNGITFAGFNVVDIKELFERTELPVIAIARDKPELDRVKEALRKLPMWRRRWKAVRKAGRIYSFKTKDKATPIYMQIAGISSQDAEKIVKKTCTRNDIPEVLRVAHMIASGLAEYKVKLHKV